MKTQNTHSPPHTHITKSEFSCIRNPVRKVQATYLGSRKYSTTSVQAARLGVPGLHSAPVGAVLSASYSCSTWKRHEAAFNSFRVFESHSGSVKWPITVDTLLDYSTWLANHRKVKASTIESYLSSLKSLHELKGFPSKSFDNPLLKAVIRGIDNLELYDCNPKHTRKVMTLPLLKLLGHEIAGTSWSENSKLTVWCASTVAFFGCFRMGEILPAESGNTDDTLLWQDVKIYDESHVLFHIKTPKSKNKQGEFVDIFRVKGHGVCPVMAITKLRSSLPLQCSKNPVFMFENGTLLTMKKFNNILQTLLTPHIGHHAQQMSCHSFRAGIPSTLAKFPDLANSQDIKGWARWKGEDYNRYTRLEVNRRRHIFTKVMSILNNN